MAYLYIAKPKKTPFPSLMGSNKQINHKWAFCTGSCLGESTSHATSLIAQVETKPDFSPLPVILTPNLGLTSSLIPPPPLLFLASSPYRSHREPDL